MLALEIFFWVALLVVGYAYAGYGVVVYCLGRLKRALRPATGHPVHDLVPEVAVVVPAFNEAGCIGAKIANCQGLDYPRDSLKIVVVNDGSTDGTPEIARRFAGVEVLHRPQRVGKAAAINHAMAHVTSPIVILSDANTLVNRTAVREIVRHYADPTVGAVAGEKRIRRRGGGSAVATSEGLYWRYESLLKRLDSELWTVVGADGGLLSYRRELFEPLEPDAILDDFVLSLRIAAKGYRVVYEPAAYVVEDASASIAEELKRRIRIAAGGWQSMLRLRSLLALRRHAMLSFQYLSHRVLRWSVVPLLLLLLLPTNVALAAAAGPAAQLYPSLLFGQMAFYGLALAGYLFDRRGYRIKALSVPYYFVVTNYAVLRGFGRFLAGRQPATWERVRRAVVVVVALGWGSIAHAQARDASVHGQISLSAVHFDNMFQAPDGQPEQALWGQRLQGRLLAPVGPGGVLIYGEADGIRLPGYAPAFGAGVGVQRTGKAAFDASVSYLWNRPAAEAGEGFSPAGVLRFASEGSYRPVAAVQFIGRGQFRREQSPTQTFRNGTAYELGPVIRYRGFGYAFFPEVGLLLGARDARDRNEMYRERGILVGASSLPWGSRVYLSASYRRRVRSFVPDDSLLSNFGRVDRRHQVSVTTALALRRGLSWVAYYARERGRSTRSGENFTAGFFSVGLAARF